MPPLISNPATPISASDRGSGGATITGSLAIIGSTGPVIIGGPSPNGPCAPSRITGPVTVTGNTGGVQMIGATVTGPVQVMLMAAGYVFNQDGPEAYADVSASEAVGTGYVAGGVAIGTRSVTVDAASNETRLLGDPVQWLASTITARGAVIYVNAGGKPVLGYCDFVTDRTSENGLFRIEWPVTGVLRTRAL